MNMRMRIVRTTTLTLATLLVATVAGAHVPERLGKVDFPTSCAPSVQAQFERAVALQHSFWFGEAIKGFAAVAQADPTCGAGERLHEARRASQVARR